MRFEGLSVNKQTIYGYYIIIAEYIDILLDEHKI